MPESLFSLNEWNVCEAKNRFRRRDQQEYYARDFRMDSAQRADVRSNRVMSGPISIVNQWSRTNIQFRRTQKHIREDGTDLSILWFVKRGHLSCSDQHGTKTAKAGDFAITRSIFPFLIECQVDPDSLHEVLHVTVPTHVLKNHLPYEPDSSLFFTPARPEFAIAQNIFAQVFLNDDDFLEDSSRLLVETALRLIDTGIRGATAPERLTLAETKLRELVRFTQVHISNPQLSTGVVARSCGISPRYASTLFQQLGTTFGKFLWSQRLERAKEWLASSDPRSTSVSEIAYAVGFKSTAHFSRSFRKAFKVSPSDVLGDPGFNRIAAFECSGAHRIASSS